LSIRSGVVIGCLAALFAAGVASVGFAASWDGFAPATVEGISLDKPLQGGVLDYRLELNSAPTITIGGKTYTVNWIQAFYVASDTADGAFLATGGSGPSGWSWDSKTNPGQISGWSGKGNDRLKPGDSALISFGSFDPLGTPVVPAYHIGYQVGGKEVTGWYRTGSGSGSAGAPEPAGLVALCTGMAGLSGALWLRKTRRSRREQAV
jgi:hypothetical protein